VRYKQNNISVGDSIKAALNISETAMAGGGCAHGAEPDQ
jgi:hypothetical protein